MARYRKIDSRIWNDLKVRALSDRGKLAFLFVLTHPHMTALGAMRAALPGLAEELGWTSEAFREAFGEALSKGLLKHDEKASFVWAPNFLKYNQPESPNVVKAWGSALDLLPECGLKDTLIQHVKAFAEGLREGFAKALPEAFREAFAKGMPNQEQEQEQEQKKQSYSAESAPPPAAPPVPAPPLALVGGTALPKPFIEIPDHTGKPWPVYPEMLDEWRELFPAVDVPQQLRSMKAWADANPKKRKTAAGMRRFIVGWLSKEQDKGPRPSGPRGTAPDAAEAGAWGLVLTAVRDQRVPADPKLAIILAKLGGLRMLGDLSSYQLDKTIRPQFEALYRGEPPRPEVANG